ncbi:SecDF P1 head subdomain-containing protein [Pseudobythopirellula maris]|uniref:SecDF P1 head subdomain-containing protein n=1 Tax=Pseudobythopirellula maris TaxID=2527991 RepID=UPI0011B71E4A|nr:hypothetical protein [Pseudobythopirellula maris]
MATVAVRLQSGATSQPPLRKLLVTATPAGAAKLKTATATLIGLPVAVVLNGEVVATPKIASPLGGSFAIAGPSDETLDFFESIIRD